MKRWSFWIVWCWMATGICAQSVLPNGDFEQADPSNSGKPSYWELPDGLAKQWKNAPDSEHGKAIRFDTSLSEVEVVESYKKMGLNDWVFPNPKKNAIAETYGLSLYSDAIPVKAGKAYRVTCEYMSEKGTDAKIWFRGYGDFNGKTKRLYEGVLECNSKGKWQTFTGVFHPTQKRPNVTQIKIMLFAYYPAGVAWFDNIKLEEIDEPPAETPSISN